MKIFIIAGESSGDRLAAALISGLKYLHPGVEFKGVAGPEMMQEGLESLFPMSELSVMGLAEILPKYRHFKRRIAQTAQATLDWQPDILITVDSPDFCLRVARKVKASNPQIRTTHYVAPTVWAWRPKRAEKMSHFIDHVLALFPFEPPYMQAHGIACDFVGHPIATIDPATSQEIAEFFESSKLSSGRQTLAVLPGSRRSEISRLLPIFLQTLDHPGFEDLQLVFPTLPHLESLLRDHLREVKQPFYIQAGSGMDPKTAARQRHVAYSASRAALAASGTVSLELAAAGTPMIIAYDMSFISRQIISRMLRVDSVTLVNLVTDTREVPEFIGKNCDASKISPALQNLLSHPNAQGAVLETTMDLLGRGGPDPGIRAARAILEQC